MEYAANMIFFYWFAFQKERSSSLSPSCVCVCVSVFVTFSLQLLQSTLNNSFGPSGYRLARRAFRLCVFPTAKLCCIYGEDALIKNEKLDSRNQRHGEVAMDSFEITI